MVCEGTNLWVHRFRRYPALAAHTQPESHAPVVQVETAGCRVVGVKRDHQLEWLLPRLGDGVGGQLHRHDVPAADVQRQKVERRIQRDGGALGNKALVCVVVVPHRRWEVRVHRASTLGQHRRDQNRRPGEQ